MLLQDAESAINWYVEVSEMEGAKEMYALLGTPGLNYIASTLASSQVRAMWVLPGGTTALIVSGATVFLITVSVPATQTSIAQFTLSTLGTLNTNSGPVCIRDNGLLFGGLGGYALILDGLYGYYYNLTGINTTAPFTAALTSGSVTGTFASTLPAGLIIAGGTILTDTAASVPGGTTITAINYNALTFTMSNAAGTTQASDSMTLTVPAFGVITDPGFPTNPTRCAFIEGWLIVNQGGSRTFQTNGPTAYTMLWPASFYALKDSSTDNLVTLFENNRELWLVGERTTEVWYNAGGATFSFARIPGVGPQIGTSAAASITRAGSSLYWLARNEQGENMIVATNQYTWQRVSNHAVEHAITQYPVVSDCISYAYEEEGHLFVVFTFPTADATWVYDVTVSQNFQHPLWHQRASFNQSTGQYHRHLSNCFMNFADVRIVGDYQNGEIYQMSRQFYTDNGSPLRAQRRTRHVWNKPNRQRIFQSSLQIEFTPGVGLQSGQGSNPQVMLRWSNDGGFTWSNEHWLPIGAAGVTKNRCINRLMGYARDRVYEINYTDPTPRDVIGATLFMEPEAAN
jgi:hypothetical protein